MTLPLWLSNLYAFIKSPWGLRACIVLAVVMLAGGFYFAGRSHQREADQQAARTAQAAAEVKDAHADAKADVQHAKDDAKVSALQKDLQHADDATQDSVPSAARRAFNCERLRKANPRAAVSAGC